MKFTAAQLKRWQQSGECLSCVLIVPTLQLLGRNKVVFPNFSNATIVAIASDAAAESRRRFIGSNSPNAAYKKNQSAIPNARARWKASSRGKTLSAFDQTNHDSTAARRSGVLSDSGRTGRRPVDSVILPSSSVRNRAKPASDPADRSHR
jgi:hypothetical protein